MLSNWPNHLLFGWENAATSHIANKQIGKERRLEEL